MKNTLPSSQGRPRWQTETIEQAQLAAQSCAGCARRCLGRARRVSSDVLMERLDRITEFRLEHGWLLFLLPAAGPVIGFGDHSPGRPLRARQRVADRPDPRTHRMGATPHGTAGTGRNVGDPPVRRLGRTRSTALQMSGSLSDVVARALQRLLPRLAWRVRPRRADLLSMPFGRAPTEIYG